MARNTQDHVHGQEHPGSRSGVPVHGHGQEYLDHGTPRTMGMASNLETNCTQESHLVVKTRLFSILGRLNRLK